MRTSDAWDTKSIAVLAFDGGVLSAFLALDGANWLRDVGLGLIGLSVLAALLALNLRGLHAGPDLREFYNTQAASGIPWQAQLLSQLDDAAKKNALPLGDKGLYWTVASGLLGFGLLAGSLSAAISGKAVTQGGSSNRPVNATVQRHPKAPQTPAFRVHS